MYSEAKSGIIEYGAMRQTSAIKSQYYERVSTVNDYTKSPKQLELFERRTGKTGKRLTEHDYRKVAVYRDVEWIGTILPLNNETKTAWRCKICSHEWLAVYGNVARNDTGCPICSKETQHSLRLTVEKYTEIETQTGYQWLDHVLIDANSKSQWRCHVCNHVWLTSYTNLKQGRGCPECAKKVRADKTRHTNEDYFALAHEKGVEWIGTTCPKSSRDKTQWQCTNGHIYKRCYSQMVKSDYGCPYCGIESRVDRTRLKQDDYTNAAVDRGIRWIGTGVPKNNRGKTLWGCSKGHTFEACYHDIVGSAIDCPYCLHMVNGQRTSKQQRTLAEMLNGEMNIDVDRYSIDIVLFRNDCPIAVEYDGWFWHGHKEDYDTQRTKTIMQAGWRMIRILSNELIPSLEQLEIAIQQVIIHGYAEIILEDWGVGSTFEDVR